MNVKLIIVLLFFLACKPKKNDAHSQSQLVESVTPESKTKLIDESFSDFFNKFKVDSLFQIERIDNPLSVIISDEELEEEEKQDIKYVSFNQKDWDVEIEYKTITISKDTMNVVLEGIDTGVRIEHLFAKRNDKWYLFQIKNLSD